MKKSNDRIAILLSGYKSGGDTKVVLNLVNALARQGKAIDLVLASAAKLALDLPSNVRIIDLQTPLSTRTLTALKLLPPLIRYLWQEQPKVLISNLIFTNSIAVLAKQIAFVPTKLVLVEHIGLSKNHDRADEPNSRFIPFLMRKLYPKADAVVANSQAMARDLESDFKLKDHLTMIYNAAIDESLQEKAQEPCKHPWLQANQPPVFLGVGRFAHQKDFATLIRAFALLRQQMPARLIILGEGGLRGELEALIRDLEIAEDVDLPGFDPNPYPYMSRASVFVLSSRWEALPTVLLEAMACGCQIVGTDCPYGVEEILAGGEWGQLVSLEAPEEMAQAMKQALASPISAQAIQLRAADFNVDRAVTQYLALIEQL
ncbi:MAG: glycosyltransferase [Leptolyngbya sp. Prado105]|jgi:glycosyltransferase involved in cell wall biosynthesis|nr:glycosyltransferase [Leptolyngbya sp. Prado105]